MKAYTYSTLVLFLLLLIATLPLNAQEALPVIDMHLHAASANSNGPAPTAICTPIEEFTAWDQRQPYQAAFGGMLKNPPCEDPVWGPETDQGVMEQTIQAMEDHNIVLGVLSGTLERTAEWLRAAPGRFLPGLTFNLARQDIGPDSLRTLMEDGTVSVFAEIANQYSGILPGDERMEPYWALAEELDIPVGIHIGTGPPGVIYAGASNYRAYMHSPLTLEEVLVRHPRLRIYIMHAGFPMLDDLLAVLYAHPQVYVDVGVIVFTQPEAVFYRYLRGIVEAGFGNRIMFGSDQMNWPGAIGRSIARIKEAPFLSEQQKRDILYNNAARFLRLSEEEIARHHGGR